MSGWARADGHAGLHCAAWEANSPSDQPARVAAHRPTARGHPAVTSPQVKSGLHIQQAAHHLVSGFQDLYVGHESVSGTHLVHHILGHIGA